MSDMLHVTDENFDAEVMNSEMPVLVDFGATWCGPCKKLEPIVDELATEFLGKVKVCHVNVDNARNAAVKFGVMSVPTLLFMKGGEVVDSQVGLLAKEKIVEKLNGLL